MIDIESLKTIFMVCVLEGLRNENETHVYLARCNLGIRIKCMGPTQFGNKEWESHSHGRRLGMSIPIP